MSPLRRSSFSALRAAWSCLLTVLLLAFLHTPTQAQVTEVTEQNLLDLFQGSDRTLGAQSFSVSDLSATNTDIADFVNATGAGAMYDLRSFDFVLESVGLLKYRTFSEASAANWPGTSDTFFQNAGYAVSIDVADATGDATGSVYNYLGISASEFDEYGQVILADDGSGNTFQASTKYDPAYREGNLPLQFGTSPTSWAQNDIEQTGSTSGGFGTTTIDQSGEVDGYGTAYTPYGTVDVIRIKRTETTTTTFQGAIISTGTETQYELVSPSLGYPVAVVTEEDNGSYSISLIAQSNAYASTAVTAGQTGSLLSSNGASVSFATGSSSAGEVAIATFATSPLNETFSGSAQSDDGSSITPNTLWSEVYWSILNLEGALADFSAEVCLSLSGVGGVLDPGTLVMLTRPDADTAWTPLDTTTNGTEICASGLTSFSQFAIGGNDAQNPLPVELTDLQATANGGDVLVSWTTLTETNNAGFDVELRGEGAGWRTVGFVRGAGTTDAATRYRHRISGLEAGTYRIRLRQMDTDGAATLSTAVPVTVRPDDALALRIEGATPVRGRATVALTLRDAADVDVALYDLLGRRVARVHSGALAGNRVHRLPLRAAGLPSGIYFLRATADGRIATAKVTVVR